MKLLITARSQEDIYQEHHAGVWAPVLNRKKRFISKGQTTISMAVTFYEAIAPPQSLDQVD